MKNRTVSLALLTGTILLAGCFQRPQTSHPQFGKEVWVGVAALSGTKDPAVNGAAIGHLFEDGTFVESVQLNIDPAPRGSEYGAWLTNDKRTERIFLGVLSSATNDVRYNLSYKGKDDPRPFTIASVTLQSEGKHAVPGQEVANGKVSNEQSQPL